MNEVNDVNDVNDEWMTNEWRECLADCTAVALEICRDVFSSTMFILFLRTRAPHVSRMCQYVPQHYSWAPYVSLIGELGTWNGEVCLSNNMSFCLLGEILTIQHATRPWRAVLLAHNAIDCMACSPAGTQCHCLHGVQSCWQTTPLTACRAVNCTGG